MTFHIICSDTYIDSFSKLDKKTQKKSFETMRLMQRSLKSDSLKVEKLNTKLNFKSARVTQNFRVIFTQSGNTVLLVYIGHHDNAYLWAKNRLLGFDAASARPAYEYFVQSKNTSYTPENEVPPNCNPPLEQKEAKIPNVTSENSAHTSKSIVNQPPSSSEQNKFSSFIRKFFLGFFLFLLGVLTGSMITLLNIL